jgi:hypothetical protein
MPAAAGDNGREKMNTDQLIAILCAQKVVDFKAWLALGYSSQQAWDKITSHSTLGPASWAKVQALLFAA